jgi:hypothetical protein
LMVGRIIPVAGILGRTLDWNSTIDVKHETGNDKLATDLWPY